MGVTTWLQTRPGGAVRKVDRATWSHFGLGGRLCLSFEARLYILEKPYFPEGWNFLRPRVLPPLRSSFSGAAGSRSLLRIGGF
jgi:hypothetical protein